VAAGLKVFSLNWIALGIQRNFITLARVNGIDTAVWTVNEQQDINNVISWGVDGVISDYPDRVKIGDHMAAVNSSSTHVPEKEGMQWVTEVCQQLYSVERSANSVDLSAPMFANSPSILHLKSVSGCAKLARDGCLGSNSVSCYSTAQAVWRSIEKAL